MSEPLRPGRWRARVRHAAVAVLSWGLFSCAFEPLAWTPLVFVALVPWLVASRRLGPEGFLAGYLAGIFVQGAYRLAWVEELAGAQVAGAAGWMALSLTFVVMGLPLGLVLRELLCRRGMSLMAAVPLTLIAQDVMREWMAGGLTWYGAGYALVDCTRLVQVTDLMRVFPLSLWVLSVNVLVAELVLAWRWGGGPSRRALAARAAGVLAGLAFLLGYGEWRIRQVEDVLRDGPVVVGLQPNVPQAAKLTPGVDARERAHQAMLRLLSDATEHRPDAAVYVWPETSFFKIDDTNGSTGDGSRPLRRGTRMQSILNRRRRTTGTSVADELARVAQVRRPGRGTPRFAIGFTGYDPMPEGGYDEEGLGHRSRNSVIYVEHRGPRLEVLGRYDKRELVPFGEYIPFRFVTLGRARFREWIEGVAGYLPSMTPGRAGVLWEATDAEGRTSRFAVNICFEIVYPRYFREARRAGADFVVNTSNDGWYDGSAERDLVQVQTRFRALETRLSVFRVSNTGITTLIDPLGREVAVVERDGQRKSVEGFLAESVPLGAPPAPAVRWGEAASRTLVGLWALGVVLILVFKRRILGPLGPRMST